MTNTVSWVDRRLLTAVRRIAGSADVRVALQRKGAPGPQAISETPTIWVANRRTLASLLLDPEVSFGDAYSDGRLEIEGNIVSVLETSSNRPHRSRVGTRYWCPHG